MFYMYNVTSSFGLYIEQAVLEERGGGGEREG